MEETVQQVRLSKKERCRSTLRWKIKSSEGFSCVDYSKVTGEGVGWMVFILCL